MTRRIVSTDPTDSTADSSAGLPLKDGVEKKGTDSRGRVVTSEVKSKERGIRERIRNLFSKITFGAISSTADKLRKKKRNAKREVDNQSFYYKNMNRGSAEKILNLMPKERYLLRPADSNDTESLYILSLSGISGIEHHAIQLNDNGKYTFIHLEKSDSPSSDKAEYGQFDTLNDLLDVFKDLKPVTELPLEPVTELPPEPVTELPPEFLMDIESSEAEEFLEDRDPKTFLLRNSSEKSDVYIVSWKKADGGVEHTPINLNENEKYTIFGLEYETMDRLIKDLKFVGFKPIQD